ncbi:hypothetical protein [Helicobacter himalayensis]|uniref:hypothetical protein n=1 Tax=Helicobacter himalayensis TaxID=1591088 RepID=UPI000B0DE26E|nr:hypothetical protein [Helicobacter himalayensis]
MSYDLSLCHSEPLGEESRILKTALQNLRISSAITRRVCTRSEACQGLCSCK